MAPALTNQGSLPLGSDGPELCSVLAGCPGSPFPPQKRGKHQRITVHFAWEIFSKTHKFHISSEYVMTTVILTC